MQKIAGYIFIIILLLSGIAVDAQHMMQYNLNSYNGLQSDHAYCLHVDRHGYLWIGTEEGVVKYNGYSVKRFDMSTGISDPDVWNFFEDKEGRLWLSRISNEIGYIQNDVYHKVDAKDKLAYYVYPRFLRQHKDGIMFMSPGRTDKKLCIERDDTLQIHTLPTSNYYTNQFITSGSEIYYLDSGVLYQGFLDKDSLAVIEKCRLSRYLHYNMVFRYLLPSASADFDSLYAFDVSSCSEFRLPYVAGEGMYNQYEDEGKAYLITDKHAYVYDSNMRNCSVKLFTSYLTETQLKGNQVVYIINNKLWGDCITTTKSGMYMCYDMPHFKRELKDEFTKFRLVSKSINGNFYWWNKEDRLLAQLSAGNKIRYKQLNDGENIENIALSRGRVILFAKKTIAFLDEETMTLLPVYKRGVRYFVKFIRPFSAGGTSILPDTAYDMLGARDGFLADNNIFYCITRGNGYKSFTRIKDTIIDKIYHIDRYKGLFYDSVLKSNIAYGDDVVLVDTKGSIRTIPQKVLNALGVTKIEQIISDQHWGNLFIKSYDRLIVYNVLTHRYREIFHKYNLEQAKVSYQDSVLLVAGRFGVLFSKVNGALSVSKHALYPNIKEEAYKNLYDVVFDNDRVLMNTDSGLLSVSLPQQEQYTLSSSASGSAYKFILKYKGVYRNIDAGDVVLFDQKQRDMQFDVVNPAGVGDLHFQVCLIDEDSVWKELNVNEWHVPDIKAGKHYTLLVRAFDNIWESPDIRLSLYVVPTFLQTMAGKWFFWTIIILTILGSVFIIIYYTRKIVSQSHLKRNYLLSLELKSIYAQINPHFIFNTLNTGMYFIRENKNQEAYEHISSFSELLRSYLKSARNKSVLLGEEIENLENYIVLQRSRFDNKFSYAISVADNVDKDHIMIPSLLLQPFVENAINHGLLHKEGQGHLMVRFSWDNERNEITCIIDDDGIGRERSAHINSENPDKPRSYGSELISDLVKLINTSNGVKVHIEYVDKKEPETGTKVIITIKNVHHEQ